MGSKEAKILSYSYDTFQVLRHLSSNKIPDSELTNLRHKDKSKTHYQALSEIEVNIWVAHSYLN